MQTIDLPISRRPAAAALAGDGVPREARTFEALLREHDVAGPRYTSYPTADRFIDSFGAPQLAEQLVLRAERSRAGRARPLSLYVHIPFCESVCYYCACNKIVTKHHGRAHDYLQALGTELALQCELLGRGEPLGQLHLGGGTPTFLSDDELSGLLATLRAAFRFEPAAELSIEVDPRTVDAGRLEHLRCLGFNRISLGVQDFDPAVQLAVHRVQPFESVRTLMGAAREIGFASINVDLIYGLPRQTPASFERTMAQVASLAPDRIALYAYAHLPQRFKPQRRIEAAALPPPADRVQMLGAALEGFVGLGYVHIGMDHFALPEDALAVAKRQGRLHRNFQGYSTQADCDLIALGVSAIAKIGATYSQNAKTLDAYYEALRERRLPVVRGLAAGADDLVRRDIIMALMCQGRVEFSAIEAAHGVDVRRAFAAELERLTPMAAQGLIELEPGVIQVTPLGWTFVRAVAMVFDRALQTERARRDAAAPSERFSRIL